MGLNYALEYRWNMSNKIYVFIVHAPAVTVTIVKRCD